MSPTSHYLLDACSLLNFFASRHIDDILRLPYSFHIAEAVHKEANYVRRGGIDEDADEREPIEWASLISTNLLIIDSPQSDVESASYIQFATQLDDGEAMTCALALHRNWQVITDDKKVHRVMHTAAPRIACVTTLDILKVWADSRKIDTADLKAIALDIRERANYFPAPSHHLRRWWDDLLEP